MKFKFQNIIIIVIFFSLFQTLFPQQNNNQQNTKKSYIVFSGDLNAYTEYFNTNNSFKRRPNSTARLIFRPTINLFNLFQIPFEILISTEGSSARQDINQYGINPRWDWGSLYLGDFSMEFSKYTLSGIRIRGAGLELFPGNFRFSVAAGLTQRAVIGGAQNGSYKRLIFSTKIGYGNESSSYIDFILTRVKDEITSLDQTIKSITILTPNGTDVLEIGAVVPITWNSYGISGPVKIELSRDGGVTFEIIREKLSNFGSFNWIVSGPGTNQALIKITSIEDNSVFDLSDNYFSIGTGVQTSIVRSLSPVVNLNSVTPQENLVVGSKGKISLFNNSFSLEYDGSGSVYTRDLRAKEIELDSVKIPSFLKDIYKPRIGTNIDFAINTQLSLRLKYFNTRVAFKRVQPGYYSWGLASLINDVQEISVMNNLNFSVVSLSLSYTQQNDNLLKQKLFTTKRDIYNASLNVRLSKRWMSSISGNLLKMGNNSKNDSTKVSFNNIILNVNNSFNFDAKNFIQSINVNYSFQNSDNTSYLVNSKTGLHSVNFGLSIKLHKNVNTSFSANLINTSF